MIRPQETLIFIIRQMEITFHIYVNDINYVSTHFASKNKEHVSTELPLANTTRSKLMNIHQKVTSKFDDLTENNLLKRKKPEEFDNTENTVDNNVDDVKDHQPKTEEPFPVNQDSEKILSISKVLGKNSKCLT
ncbi:hypothetical protein C2G38_2029734 [Gigaspora rosea]|uniref:Uncharacterized protein n=1 Tax=Gigaspora rosea TaxID=44941 RepID=A0A397VWK2_9GLOM|nr:hypothetical protein C2G38_2029734 [Gigaspora rosea]CAG8443022.1 7000_t:CDS:1 [Gigaspora rosea]